MTIDKRGVASTQQTAQEREQVYITSIRAEAAAGFAELDRGEGIRGTPDEIMDLIDEELGISAT